MSALTLSLRTAATVGLNSRQALERWSFHPSLSLRSLPSSSSSLSNFHKFLAYPILLLMVPSLTSTGILLTRPCHDASTSAFASLPLLDTLDAWSPPAATLIWAFLALGHFAEGNDAGLPTKLPVGPSHPPQSHTRTPPRPALRRAGRRNPYASFFSYANSVAAAIPAKPSLSHCPSPEPPSSF